MQTDSKTTSYAERDNTLNHNKSNTLIPNDTDKLYSQRAEGMAPRFL